MKDDERDDEVLAYLEMIERTTGRNVGFLMGRANEILAAAGLGTEEYEAQWGDVFGPYVRQCHPSARIRWASLVLHMMNEPLYEEGEVTDPEVMMVDEEVMAEYRGTRAI